MANYVQPDYRIPTPPVDSSGHPLGVVTVQIEATAAGNPLQVTTVAKYTQTGTANPPSPVAGQLDNTALGRSKITRADGTTAST